MVRELRSHMPCGMTEKQKICQDLHVLCVYELNHVLPQDPLSYSPTERHWGPQGVMLAFAGVMSHPKGPQISLFQLGHYYYCQFPQPSLIRAREILIFMC